MTCTMTNAAHIVRCSCSLLCLSPSCLFPTESPFFFLYLLMHVFCALSPTFLFCLRLFTIFSPAPSTFLHLHLFFLPSPHLMHHSLYLFFVFAPSYTFLFLPLLLHVLSQVDWPLNIIITDSCMNKYNRLFSFLLQLKHMVWSLRDVWFHLKRTGEKMGAAD